MPTLPHLITSTLLFKSTNYILKQPRRHLFHLKHLFLSFLPLFLSFPILKQVHLHKPGWTGHQLLVVPLTNAPWLPLTYFHPNESWQTLSSEMGVSFLSRWLLIWQWSEDFYMSDLIPWRILHRVQAIWGILTSQQKFNCKLIIIPQFTHLKCFPNRNICQEVLRSLRAKRPHRGKGL